MSSGVEAIKRATKIYQRDVKFREKIFSPFLKRYPRLKELTFSYGEIRPPGFLQVKEVNENIVEKSFPTEGWVDFDIIFYSKDLPYIDVPELPQLTISENFDLYALYCKNEIVGSIEWLKEINRFALGVNYDYQNEELRLTYRIYPHHNFYS